MKGKLPLTVEMTEHAGNEKFYYFSDRLPTDSHVPSTIHKGDLMLYGSNCLVLFYDSFTTSYNYTPLGTMEDTEGLEEALGRENPEVSFSLAE